MLSGIKKNVFFKAASTPSPHHAWLPEGIVAPALAFPSYMPLPQGWKDFCSSRVEPGTTR